MQTNIEQYNKTFEKIMTEIGFISLIKSYEAIKLSVIRCNKKFEKASKSFKYRKDERIKILYKEACSELEQLKILTFALDGILGALKVVVNEQISSEEMMNNLLQMFRQKFKKYDSSFYKFKEMFTILRQITEMKYFDDQKTR